MVDYNCCGTTDQDAYASDSEDFVTENSKRKKLSLKSSKKAKLPLSPSTRFNATVSEEEIAKTSKGFVPVDTARSTGWAFRTYQTWASQRNQRCKDQCPLDLFDKPHPPECNILQKFVTEARRENGSPYPPKTLYQLLCGLLRHSRSIQEDPPNFLEMCQEAGLNGNFTNHSLRASGATQLFQNNVPEKVIQEFTGHRSTKALRQYERVAIQQKQTASNILTAGSSNKEQCPQQSFLAPIGNIPGFNFPMPVFSPVFSGHGGTINFNVNICPTGSVSVGCSDTTEKTYEKLLEGIELEDLQ